MNRFTQWIADCRAKQAEKERHMTEQERRKAQLVRVLPAIYTPIIAILACMSSHRSHAAGLDVVETVRTADVTITVKGQGQPVLMIPGLNSSADTWTRSCEALQPKVQCVTVQLPGFAGAAPSEAFRERLLTRTSEVLAQFIRQRYPQGLPVAGHSLGGVIGMHLAAKEPALVRKLLIVDSLPFLSAVRDHSVTAEQVRPGAEAAYQRSIASPAAPGANRGFFEQMARTMALSAPDQARIVQDAEASDPATSARAILELMTTDMRPLLSQIKAPTTVLAAWASTRAFGGSAEQHRQLFQRQYASLAQADIRVSQGGLHFLMWDDAALVEKALAELL